MTYFHRTGAGGGMAPRPPPPPDPLLPVKVLQQWLVQNISSDASSRIPLCFFHKIFEKLIEIPRRVWVYLGVFGRARGILTREWSKIILNNLFLFSYRNSNSINCIEQNYPSMNNIEFIQDSTSYKCGRYSKEMVRVADS